MSEAAARKLIGLLVEVLEAEARERLPGYVQDSWLGAFADLLEKGMFKAWQGVLERVSVAELEASVVEIVDLREDV